MTPPRRRQLKRGPLTGHKLTHALASADDVQLAGFRTLAAEQLARSQQLSHAIEAEIERRHWPGEMTAAAAA
jgi:hypothetical protein